MVLAYRVDHIREFSRITILLMDRWFVHCIWRNLKRYKAAPDKFEVERCPSTAQEWLLKLLTWAFILPRTLLDSARVCAQHRDRPYATHRLLRSCEKETRVFPSPYERGK